MATEDYRELHRSDYSRHESVIMTFLHDSGALTIEEILARVPDLTWSQIFLAIAALSRKGEVALRRDGFTHTVETTLRRSLAGGSNGKTSPDHR